jgi:hypothetical protein
MFSLYAGVISLIADAPVATAAVLSLERGKITLVSLLLYLVLTIQQVI